MLDDHILYEEQYLGGFKGACIRRALRFFGYFLIWLLLFTSITLNFIKSNEIRKEAYIIQALMFMINMGFLWGVVHSLRRMALYIWEAIFPVFHVYKRSITSIEKLSTGNPILVEYFGFELRRITKGTIFHLNDPIGKTAQLKAWQLYHFKPDTLLQKPVPIDILVIVGKYTGRIWNVEIMKDIEN